MITLENTQANAVAAAINDERRRMGSPTVSMVLTLLILTDEMHQAEALAAASLAAREHPMRVIALIERPGRGGAHLAARPRPSGRGRRVEPHPRTACCAAGTPADATGHHAARILCRTHRSAARRHPALCRRVPPGYRRQGAGHPQHQRLSERQAVGAAGRP